MKILLITIFLMSSFAFAQKRNEKPIWQLIQVESTNGQDFETYQNQWGERVRVKAIMTGKRLPFDQEFIRIALQDSQYQITQDEQGNTTITKPRTDKSENAPDPADWTNQNLQRIFNIGMGVGAYSLRISEEAQQRIKDDETSQMFVELHAGIRLPFKGFKRFLFGGTYQARNNLRSPSETVPWAPPAAGDDDGFTTYPRAADSYRTIFLEYDVVTFPGDDAKFALSAGIYQGFAKSTPGSDHPYKYTDRGYTLKVRVMGTQGRWDNGTMWELSPFFTYKYGTHKQSSFVGGLGFSFGPPMKRKKEIVK